MLFRSVSSLDVWLRSQLSRYDIASGFGVFTIMNAIRPELPVNSTSSPHIAAWAWQQAVEPHEADCTALVDSAKKAVCRDCGDRENDFGKVPASHLHSS